MEINNSYGYTVIKEFAEDNGFEQSDHGEEYVGENFVVLKKDDTVISFVLTGFSHGGGYIYTCVYSDV